MAVKLWHQCGHNTNWNIDSYTKDNCGDGLIFSPVHKHYKDFQALDSKVKAHSWFDPQFYLPNSQKLKLKSYPFYPDTISGDSFTTDDFTLVSFEAARLCVDFQIENKFRGIIIPTRFYDQMYPEYIDKQDAYTVTPFLKAIKAKRVKKPVLLTLPLTTHMIRDKIFRTNLLNWVTSFPEVDGVYVIITHDDAGTKQIQSGEVMFACMDFLMQLRKADLQVLTGYCNTESLLYLLVEGCDITLGTFENTRMFSIDKFVITDELRRGPKARMFSAALLNWIQFNQMKNIKQESKEIWEKIYTATKYGDIALNSATEPTFNQAPLYKHHFLVFAQLVSALQSLDVQERYKLLRSKLKGALVLYQEIDDIPMDLEKHSRGEHIQQWLDAINKFYKVYLKKD